MLMENFGILIKLKIRFLLRTFFFKNYNPIGGTKVGANSDN